ncbi:MAG: hypothetical protein Q8L78_04525 [Coxiellaceae bacterium]|nr:hypothetical protein [Coxiellaceae bacterium]
MKFTLSKRVSVAVVLVSISAFMMPTTLMAQDAVNYSGSSRMPSSLIAIGPLGPGVTLTVLRNDATVAKITNTTGSPMSNSAVQAAVSGAMMGGGSSSSAVNVAGNSSATAAAGAATAQASQAAATAPSS